MVVFFWKSLKLNTNSGWKQPLFVWLKLSVLKKWELDNQTFRQSRESRWKLIVINTSGSVRNNDDNTSTEINEILMQRINIYLRCRFQIYQNYLLDLKSIYESKNLFEIIFFLLWDLSSTNWMIIYKINTESIQIKWLVLKCFSDISDFVRLQAYQLQCIIYLMETTDSSWNS